MNVVSVFLNLDAKRHKQTKVSCWSENNKQIHFITRKKIMKTLWQRQILFTLIPFVWHWRQHIQVNTVSSSIKQYQSLHLFSISVPFSPSFAFSLSMLCLLPYHHRQRLYQDAYNLPANTESQGKGEAVTITSEPMLYKVLFSKHRAFRAELTKRLYCTRIQCMGY